jgi:DNA-3-methyladenine glycosylase II
MSVAPADWSTSTRHLKKHDPVLRRIVPRVGKCMLRPRSDYFIVLCESIFSQQISVRVAEVLFGRFRALFPNRRPTPISTVRLLERDGRPLDGVGLSRQKRAYLLDLATHFHKKRIPTRSFKNMTDEQIIECLTQVNGIGKWTAEMFLIFTLNRPDVWPVDDLGLRNAIHRHWSISPPRKPKQLLDFADHLRPHRTVATWYLWRSLSLPDASEA